MPTMSRRRWRVASHRRTQTSAFAATAMALLLAVAGSACSSSSKSGSTTTTSRANAANAETAVRQTVEGWADAFARAKTNPAGDHDELLRYGTAGFVREQQSVFDSFIRDGQRAARPADSKYMFELRSVTINGTHATAKTCSVDDINLIDVRSGSFVERDTATLTISWFLDRVGQRWLISHVQGQNELAGVKPCPAQ